MSTALSVNVELNDAITSVNRPNDVEVKPTDTEFITLEHISDRFPLTAWLIIICEFCDGFAYFGTSQIMQNYIQFPAPDRDNKQPGALNRGQGMATGMTVSYYLFSNFISIAAAIVADQFWGKYKTLVVACFIYLVGLVVLVLSSIPVSVNAGLALPGLICVMVILGVAIGGVKSTASPFMVEQYTTKAAAIKEINGDKKIIDPKITIESLFNWLYWAINLGAVISTFITTSVEKYHSYWLAYLIPLIIFPGSIIMLLIGRHRYVRVPPTGSLLVRAFRVTSAAIRNRWELGKLPNKKHLLDYVKGAVPFSGSQATTTQCDDQFIRDLKQAIHACRVFALFPFYWLCYNQVIGNLTSQAAQMNVGPVPNDVLANINPIAVVILIPIFDKILYPKLRRCNIKLSPIVRITCGFFIVALGMAWTAVLQHLIYMTGPNFNYATEPCLTCQKFNNITVAWQIPSYILLAISEIFAAITGLEYAFTNAPSTMKSIVMALYLCATGIGSALNLALVPVSVNPKLLWMYASLAIVAFIIGIIFYILFRNETKILPKYEASRRRSTIMSQGYW